MMLMWRPWSSILVRR